MAGEDEKRRFPRLDSSHLIAYTHFDIADHPDQVGMGKTLDLSLGGMTIQTHQLFQVNTGLQMLIALEEKLITIRGRVVHVREVEKELYDVGVCFTEIDVDARESLNAYFSRSQIA